MFDDSQKTKFDALKARVTDLHREWYPGPTNEGSVTSYIQQCWWDWDPQTGDDWILSAVEAINRLQRVANESR